MDKQRIGIEGTNTEWYLWNWDPPHLLERAMHTAQPSCKIFQDVDMYVHEINKHWRIGKGFTAAEGQASTEMSKFYAPLQSSQTKFTGHQLRVLNNFKHNYRVSYSLLEEEGNANLKHINNARFVLGFSIKIDIFGQITKLSNTLQQVEIMGWRAQDTIHNTFAEMKDMLSSIGTDEPTAFHEKLVELKEAYKELEKGEKSESKRITYQGKKVHMSRQILQGLRSRSDDPTTIEEVLMSIKPEVEKFVLDLEQGVKERLKRYPVPVNKYISFITLHSFRLESMLEHAEKQTVPDSFLEYFRIAEKAGYFQDDLISEVEIGEQYKQMAKAISEIHAQNMKIRTEHELTTAESEIKTYNQLLGSSTRLEFSDAADLLLSAMTRTNCEACVEGMGSIVKDVVEERSLGFENMRKEIFVSYNGPKPYTPGSQALVADALDLHFGKDNWHFHRKTKREDSLTKWLYSEVVDKRVKGAKVSDRLSYK